ncbi:hypothetical protein GCM10025868_34350 [Angustibacter aerolatus]|uniref:GlcNAc-PI de-N-acetylase n=1 Tax=Angustibacter aerolatus TaxID=1162965 RepID=A0ABQ6JIX5_9ACTN|nr:PIG-L family deacetylase [Angustibacter aerolatus]GMA88185.1 hypothetical protein GCM10025868_34350 [Angustibacter aerolatus]
MPIPDSEVERVLVVAAHPDDIDFGASGTVATWVDAGVEVTYLLCTSGDQGGFDDTPREEMPALRQAEQRAAAKAVGVTDVRFLEGYRDGWLEPSREPAARHRAGDPAGAAAAGAAAQPRARLEPHPGQPPRPPGGRRGRDPRRLPGRAQPVRLARAWCRTRASSRGRCARCG